MFQTATGIQLYLEQKAALGVSFSVVDHLRWDLRSIFRLAVQDRIITHNPAEMLFTPRTTPSKSRQVLTPHQVQLILSVLDLRERLIVQLALFSGMRPGEILALQWKHVAEDHVEVIHRLYRGKLDRPKSERSKRKSDGRPFRSCVAPMRVSRVTGVSILNSSLISSVTD